MAKPANNMKTKNIKSLLSGVASFQLSKIIAKTGKIIGAVPDN
ncbi:hypothetical protein AB8880_11370 [Alphaproteobacteria bacterium LSUCC0684]